MYIYIYISDLHPDQPAKHFDSRSSSGSGSYVPCGLWMLCRRWRFLSCCRVWWWGGLLWKNSILSVFCFFFQHFLSKKIREAWELIQIPGKITLNAQSTKKPSIHPSIHPSMHPWGSGEHSPEFDPSPGKCQHHGSFFILQLRNLRPAFIWGRCHRPGFFCLKGRGKWEEGMCVEIPGHSRNSMLELDKRNCLLTHDI